MRLAVVLLLATLTSVEADPLKPKVVDEDYAPEAADQFGRGLIGLRQGRLSLALGGFDRSFKAEPHAATAYNLAAVWSLLENPEQTTKYLAEYLRLAPKAADRKEVEALLKAIKLADPTVTIGGNTLTTRFDKEVDAILLLDGKQIGASPVTVQLKSGHHIAERITAHTYEARPFEAVAGQRAYWELPGEDNLQGNVVINTSAALFTTPYESMWTWSEGEQEIRTRAVSKLTPGTYKTDARGQLCTPIEFVVKPGDVLTYVFLDGQPRQAGKKCIDVVRATTQYLRRPQ